MDPTEICLPSPGELAEELGLSQRKRLGQCYLANSKTLNRIVGLARLDPDTAAVEIGAGPGYLTKRILARTRRVVAVEIDERFRAVHERYFGDLDPPVQFMYGDVLRLDWRQLLADIGDRPYVVIGNIPYQITSPLLEILLELSPLPQRSVLLVQREFAQRLSARPGRRAYGALTAKMALIARVSQGLFVPRQRFHPRPRVDAAAIVIEPRHPALVDASRREAVFRLVNACFAHRRKKIVNSLLDSGHLGTDRDAIAALLTQAQIDAGCRAETLEPRAFVRLAEALDQPRDEGRSDGPGADARPTGHAEKQKKP